MQRLAWYGSSDVKYRSPELKQAHKDRFGDFDKYDLFSVDPDPLFPWAGWA